MASKPLKARWHQAAFFMLALSIFIFFVFNAIQSESKANNVLETRDEDLSIENVVALGTTYANTSLTSTHGRDGPTPHLRRQAQTRTLTYYNAWCKGGRYLQLIRQGNPNGPVRIRQEDVLGDDGGWSLADDYPRTIEPNILDAVKGLGVSTNQADIVKAALNQYNVDFINQNGHRATEQSGGTYLNSFIPKSGAIIAVQNTSPEQNIIGYYRDHGMPRPSPYEIREMLPKYHRWSDLVWILWAKYAGDQAGNLRYIFRENMINNDTRGVIDDIFDIEHRTLYLPWPGKSFDIRARTSESGREKFEGDDARALLGTPHGVGISYLLADHKDVLGDRTVKMTVFTSEYATELQQQYFMVVELIKL